MCEPYYFSDASKHIDELKKSQLINAYTVFLALSKNKNVTSLEDFCNLRSDVAVELQNLISFQGFVLE